MKLIRTENQIVSLENAIEVKKNVIEHRHTSHGEKYSLYDFVIVVKYTGGELVQMNIPDQKDEKNGNELFEKIFSILSE